MMIRSGRWRSAAATSWLAVIATCPAMASTASQRTALGWAIFSSAGCSITMTLQVAEQCECSQPCYQQIGPAESSTLLSTSSFHQSQSANTPDNAGSRGCQSSSATKDGLCHARNEEHVHNERYKDHD